jgi:hypothetical protein
VNARAERRLTRKTVDKILAEYNLPRRVREHFATLGDLVWERPADVVSAPRSFDTCARYRDHVILTNRGMLGVTVHEDWIACVFDDVEAGARVGATRPSGKWNHHAFVGYCHEPTSREDILAKLNGTLAEFILELSWIVDRRFAPETRATLEKLVAKDSK